MTVPCTVGLTGGLASGKSSVAGVLASWGIPVFDADLAVHRLYMPGGAGARTVASLFGPQMLGDDGAVNRGRLGGVVLDDERALDRLNRAIHPLVRDEINRWRRTIDEPVAVVEAALLIETGAASGYDVVVVVACGARQQLERAIARGVPRDRAAAIIASQAPIEAKVEAADVVIDNSGRQEDLGDKVERAWRDVVELCSGRRRISST